MADAKTLLKQYMASKWTRHDKGTTELKSIALFLSEFLYRAIREEAENRPLFAYLQHSIIWLDECGEGFANFHLVFLMRLSRFLGLYPNLEDYHTGDYFDLLNACFTSIRPQLHSSYINPFSDGPWSFVTKRLSASYTLY